MSGLEWTFDTAAHLYERMRPGYPDELYETIFDYAPIGRESSVIEIGIGGGQATLPILKTGCSLTAVEYGVQFSNLVSEKFSLYSNFSVITGRFEETKLEENSADLVFSASAFHWIPEKEGYEKVYSVLKKGGAFARFANHPYRDKDNPELSREIDEAYREYYDRFHNKQSHSPSEYTEEQARERAQIAQSYGFRDIKYALFYRQRRFTAKEYSALLGTYSDHIAISEPIRAAFFARIEEAIDRHGGSITLYDTIDLQLARK